MRLLIGDKFFDSFIQLPKRIQKKVVEFQDKFKENRKSAAINLESISTFKDQSLRTARIDQKYRAIIGTIKDREDYYILWVDNHDEAMAWAENKTFEWNDVTNTPQLYTVETAEKELEAEPDWAKIYGYEEPKKNEAITSLSEEELLKMGVPDKLVDKVSQIDSFAKLEKMEKRLPEDVFENLFYLLDGVPYSEVIDEVEQSKQSEDGDTLAFKRFYVEVDDELLERMLEGDLEKWSLFLHPSQRSLVNKEFNGEVKVTGGAGTGKTVAAIHRLKYLVDKYGSNRKILFATYTNALKRNLESQIGKLNIESSQYDLSTIDAAAQNLGRSFGLLSKNSTITELSNSISSKDVWEKVLETEVSSFDADFLIDEANQILYYYDLTDRRAYFNQTRFGRGTPITRKQRLEVWKLFEKYQEYKSDNEIIDRYELFNKVSAYLNEHPKKRPYQHIVLDEVQDCSNVEVRFIRSLADEGENDLFLVGDPYQSIYGKKVVFSQTGVNIRGRRSKKLKVNYRTTEEIKKYALSALKGVTYNNFDGEEENLHGYVSIFHGKVPLYQTFDSKNDEHEFILNSIREITNNDNNVSLSNVVIATRTKESYREIMSQLHKAGIEYFDVRDETGNRNGVHLCTFHSLKGLEYKAVILADVNDRTCPQKPFGYQDWNEEKKESHINSEKSLLYTAMTRAILDLGITGTGNKSEIIK